MQEVRASENISIYIPENDTQELWQLSGRMDALRDYLLNSRVTSTSTVFVDDVLAIIGCSVKEKAGVGAPT